MIARIDDQIIARMPCGGATEGLVVGVFVGKSLGAAVGSGVGGYSQGFLRHWKVNP